MSERVADIETEYEATLNYLFAKLPMFSRIGKAALKPDLTNTLRLCEVCGNPEQKFTSVHIAGTNGKGSVSHGLAAIFQGAGHKTGLYTSPHLIDFRERIRIDGIPVPKEWVIAFVQRIQEHIEIIQPSFFEITVAMAFTYFAEQGVDIAVIETGLGGRLDSTNVITPVLSIITNISYDHKDLLGQTLPEIAFEKAGIIKQGVPALIGERHAATEAVFSRQALLNKAPLFYADTAFELRCEPTTGDASRVCFASDIASGEQMQFLTDLHGSYQHWNLRTILAALRLLQHEGFELPTEKALAALGSVKSATGLRGRWDILKKGPLIICDVAHNPAGLTEVLAQWTNLEAEKKNIVLGFVKDKEVDAALALFPKDATYYFCNAGIPRALPAAELQEAANRVGLNGEQYPTVAVALEAAIAGMGKNDALLVTGSFFVVGEALEAAKRLL
jgi:dihydrofolate synthase / folylpolyglutamate synthase